MGCGSKPFSLPKQPLTAYVELRYVKIRLKHTQVRGCKYFLFGALSLMLSSRSLLCDLSQLIGLYNVYEMKGHVL